jgi:hypothetical protein
LSGNPAEHWITGFLKLILSFAQNPNQQWIALQLIGNGD